MFAILGLAFLFVLLSSLSGPKITQKPAKVFDDVVTGQTALRRYAGTRVWATRLGPRLRKHAQEVAAHVLDPLAGCSVDQELCIINAATDRSGIEIAYTDKAPTQLPAELPWYGGFVDPINGRVFDRLGRAYKTTSKDVASLPVIAFVDK